MKSWVGSGKTRAVPEGRLKWEGRSPVYPQPLFTGQYSQDFILGNHQPSLRGLKSCALHYPALDVLGYFQSSLRDCCMIAPVSGLRADCRFGNLLSFTGSSPIFSTSYISKQPRFCLIWTAMTLSRPCGTEFVAEVLTQTLKANENLPLQPWRWEDKGLKMLGRSFIMAA
jgi:hypothetical protein